VTIMIGIAGDNLIAANPCVPYLKYSVLLLVR